VSDASPPVLLILYLKTQNNITEILSYQVDCVLILVLVSKKRVDAVFMTYLLQIGLESEQQAK
jgi:hypothetical protein